MAKKASSCRGPGRPSAYTPEIGEEICERLALGESLRTICDDHHMPHVRTVLRWLRGGEPSEFATNYARAREVQAEMMADELQDIADDGRNDRMERLNKDGEVVGYSVNNEVVQRSKLRVETRRWIAERILAKKYGTTRVEHEHSGEITLKSLTDEQLEARIAKLEGDRAQ